MSGDTPVDLMAELKASFGIADTPTEPAEGVRPDLGRDGRWGVQQRSATTGQWTATTINCGYHSPEEATRAIDDRGDGYRVFDRQTGEPA